MQSLYSSVFSASMGGLCCGPARVADDSAATTVIRRNVSDSETAPVGNLLIFVNPHSGPGKGVKTFHSKVAPLLKKNNVGYELVITNGPNHARSMVTTRQDLGKFHGIMILSGDGLVYEVLNGLCERADAAELVPRLPIGIVPSGSGNGLLASLFAAKGWSLKSPAFPNQAILVATGPRPEAQPINLLHVQTDKFNSTAFLSIGWGIMADIDIESERFRKTLGSNRFLVSALVRCLKLRTYHGRLSYKPFVAGPSNTAPPFDVYGTSSRDMISMSSPVEGATEEISLGSRTLDEWWRGRHVIRTPQIEAEPPGDWITIDDEFVGVYGVSLSHIAADGPFMPRARLDDDRIYLTYILRKDVKSKMDLIKMLSAIESEKHLDLPFFKTVEVTTFRLEPHDQGSYIVVDGEVVEAERIQATVTGLKTAVFS